MKKLLSFLFIFVCAFTLAACTNKDNGKEESTKITVNFETNGGSAVASTTVDTTNASSFVLPANPTKEGYAFDGWYLDQAFTTPFTALGADLNNVTLYAKWIEDGKGLSASVNVAFAVKLDTSEPQYDYDDEGQKVELDPIETHVDLNANLQLSALVETTEVENLDDLKASLALTLTLKDNANTESYGSEEADAVMNQLLATPVVLNLYVNGGYAYASYGMVSYKVKLADLVEALQAKLEEGLDSLGESAGIELEIPETADDAMEYILGKVTELVDQYSIDMGLVGELIEKLVAFIPSAKVENGKTIYEITQADLEADLDSLAAWVDEKALEISTQVYTVINSIVSQMFNHPVAEYTDEETGNVFSLEKAGWTDKDGKFHSFTEDFEEENFGEYNEQNNTYNAYMLNAYFKVENNALVSITYTEYEELKIGTTFTDPEGNVYTYGGLSYTDKDGKVVSLTENFDALVSANVGYIDTDNNTFHVFATNDIIDMEAKEIYDEQAHAIAESAESLKEGIKNLLPLFKAAVTINKARLELTDNSAALNLDFAFDSTPLKEAELLDEDVKLAVKLTFNLQFAKSSAKVTYPDLSGAIDMTDAVLSEINGDTPAVEEGE